jgi:hypothetical protein
VRSSPSTAAPSASDQEGERAMQDDDKKMTTQCGNPCTSTGEWNHSCTSELTQADFTMAA